VSPAHYQDFTASVAAPNLDGLCPCAHMRASAEIGEDKPAPQALARVAPAAGESNVMSTMMLAEQRTAAALKAWVTRRASIAPSTPLAELERRLRNSMRGALSCAMRREAAKAAKGRPAARVTVTLDQLMAKLRATDFRCAISGLPFWFCGRKFGPSIPSIDRIKPDGDYSNANTRFTLLGVNAGRGCGSDADMYRIAKAIIARKAKGSQ